MKGKIINLELRLKDGVNPEMVESLLTDHADKEGWLEEDL